MQEVKPLKLCYADQIVLIVKENKTIIKNTEHENQY